MHPLKHQQQLRTAINHHKAGDLAAAEAEYRRLLTVTPRDPALLHLLGVLCQQTNRRDLAIGLIQKAIDNRADFPEALNNLSVALNEVGRCEEAARACEKAIALKPDYPAAHINLGNALRELGELENAVAVYRKAMKLQRPSATFMTHLAAALHDHGDMDESVAVATEAVRLDPRHAPAHQILGHALKATGHVQRALDSYNAAINLNPGDSSLHSSWLYCLNFSAVHDAASIQKELVEWNNRHARPLLAKIKPHENDRASDRRLRVGYVSPSFRAHSMAMFVMPILRCHDKRQFEVFCYSDVMRPDAITQQFRQHADHWVNIVGQSDEEVAEQIRRDRIDILVDPNMHMSRNRLLMFARKPAPVQVTGLGHPGSTGLATMDYRLTDPHLDPPGGGDQLYTERLVRLPNTFWCYNPLTEEPEVNRLPAESGDGITFGCLNHFYKVNSVTVELFAKVLHAVLRSRLLLLCPCDSGRTMTLNHFQSLGIDSARIEFVSLQPRPEYLRTYHRIDITLDVLPYNGHTTSMDSLWMGVPVISQIGCTTVGRAGLSILTNLNLPNLIADSAEEYVEIAARVSADLKRLVELRRTLRERMKISPLMNASQCTRDIESAYRGMWREWCSASAGT